MVRSAASILRRLAPSPAFRAVRASPEELIPVPKRFFHPPRTSTLIRPSPIWYRSRPIRFDRRHEATSSNSASQSATSTAAPESRLDRDQVPAYELTFTCKVCSTRSSHRISKQGYHHGTVLISCPGCKNRHLISDHLKIFSDKRITVEDIMREKGNLVKRGTLSAEGDVEFWDDGTSTSRSSHFHPNSTTKSDPDAPEGKLTEQPPSEQAAQKA